MATKTTTKTTASKKTASKAKAGAKATTKAGAAKATESNSLVDVTAAAQERYFSVLEQGQTAALEGFETVVETINRIADRVGEQVTDRFDMPTIPGIDALPSSLPKLSIPENMPSNMVDSYFEFANKALANQREFANKALAIATKS